MKNRMKSPLLIAVLLAAGVAVAGTAMARGGDCSHEPRADRAAKVSMMKERHAERAALHLDALAERLALRADQRPAWNDFRESLASPRPQHEPRTELPAKLTASERAQKMERAAETRLEGARKVRQATDALYAVLDAEQRKVLDEQRQPLHGSKPGHEQHQPRPPRS